MRSKTLKITILAASCLVGAAQTDMASAHAVDTASLGGSKNATDSYQITCTTDGGGETDHLAIQVLDAAPKAAPKVSVQVFKGGLAASSTDATDGNASFSPEVEVHGGNGVYYVLVDKTGAAAENYRLEYHCQPAGEGHSGTSIIQLQDQ